MQEKRRQKGKKSIREVKMEVRLIENKKDEKKLSFILKGSTAEFVNTLRRIITDEVPTMAIEDVEFTQAWADSFRDRLKIL